MHSQLLKKDKFTQYIDDNKYNNNNNSEVL